MYRRSRVRSTRESHEKQKVVMMMRCACRDRDVHVHKIGGRAEGIKVTAATAKEGMVVVFTYARDIVDARLFRFVFSFTSFCCRSCKTDTTVVSNSNARQRKKHRG